ncbi:MAG: outer membrane lipoprotein carrier protein LolA [Acidobacteriota bacterium]
MMHQNSAVRCLPDMMPVRHQIAPPVSPALDSLHSDEGGGCREGRRFIIRPHRWLMVGFLVVLGIGGSLKAETVDQLVSRLQEKYEELESFSAEFDQLFNSRVLQLRESGIVMMKKPGKMYWEYQHPTSKFFIADGQKSYFYVPRDRQVIVSDLDLSEVQTPLMFLLGRGNIQDDFQVELEEQEEALEPTNTLIRLIPKQPQGEFSFLILEVNPSTHLIRRLVVVEPIGNRNEYILNNFQENIDIPDRQFDFEVPEDVDLMSR